jgi:very-short-patch-repair endonuclease
MSTGRVSNNKRTKEQFIEKATNIHGNKWDYSKVEYRTCKDNVVLICKIHGEFNQTPDAHIQGQGCPKCRYTTIALKTSKTQAEFIREAKQKHGDLYDYSQTTYKNFNTKVDIICRTHGIFSQKAGKHLRGEGCIKCAGVYSYTTEEWIKLAKQKHGEDKFDYSKVLYKLSTQEITIGCKICNRDFKQLPPVHLNSKVGCDWCRKKHWYSTEEWIEEAKKIQTPSSHLGGSGCNKCSKKYSPTTEEWIQKAIAIHGDIYDYSKSDYKAAFSSIIIICKKHGEWECSPNNHLHSSGPTGCPSCVRKGESKLIQYLLNHHEVIREEKTICPSRRFDCCIDKLKIIVELDGFLHFVDSTFHNSVSEHVKKIDVFKMKCAIEKGYRIIRLLQEDVFKNGENWLDEHLKPHLTLEGEKLVYICPNNPTIYDSHKELLNNE